MNMGNVNIECNFMVLWDAMETNYDISKGCSKLIRGCVVDSSEVESAL